MNNKNKEINMKDELLVLGVRVTCTSCSGNGYVAVQDQHGEYEIELCLCSMELDFFTKHGISE
jgi:hypothetical protein